MVLNPVLFDGLRSIFGEVVVTDQNTQLEWRWTKDAQGNRVPEITYGGEQYYVNCPVCGDQRQRLSMCHRLLTPLDKLTAPEPITHKFYCLNENCDVRKHPKWDQLKEYVKNHEGMVGLAVARHLSSASSSTSAPEMRETRLPLGFMRLDQFDHTHPACQFIWNKYGLNPHYLARAYGVGFCSLVDPEFLSAYNRIIFPIFWGGKLISWQGRTIDPSEDRRWWFPAGFKKVLYNHDAVPNGDVAVIAEGIPAAISCGPTGIAIFGKNLDPWRIDLIVKKYRTAVIATDPTTMIPDPNTRRKKGVGYDPKDNGRVFAQELSKKLVDHGMKIPPVMLPYPEEVMAAARQNFEQRRAVMDGKMPKPLQGFTSVPDPADVGIRTLQNILRSLPESHRSAYLCRA